MLSLTHPTNDLYLCLTHDRRSTLRYFAAPTDITFSERADELCIIIIIITVEERTCALPGIVFNSKPRLIFNPYTMIAASAAVMSFVVYSYYFFCWSAWTTYTVYWYWFDSSYTTFHIEIHTHRRTYVLYRGWHWSSWMFALPCFVARLPSQKLIQQKSFLLLRGRVHWMW